MKELEIIAREVERLRAEGRGAVLATVVDIQGSSYRLPGARMLIAEGRWIAGSVSGGCLESDVVLRAEQVLQTGHPVVVSYDTTSDEDILFGVGLGCRGIIKVLIEPLRAAPGRCELIGFLRRCMERREAGIVATVVDGVRGVEPGARLMRSAEGNIESDIGDETLKHEIEEYVSRLQPSETSHTLRHAHAGHEIAVFVEIVRPPLPFLIFGAGHDAMPLARFAKELGWRVSVVDHRPAYATRERFPLADEVIVAGPEQLAQRIVLDKDSVAVVMTHNYLRDLQVLKLLLPSPVRYVGLLGPRRRAGELLEELEREALELTTAQRGRLYAPVGLNLGAEGPEGVALSVLAEIQAVVAGRIPSHLRETKGSIHGPAAGNRVHAESEA